MEQYFVSMYNITNSVKGVHRNYTPISLAKQIYFTSLDIISM